MKIGMKTMTLLNKGANVAKMFGLPFTEVGGAIEETLGNITGKLDGESSVAEFECLQQATDETYAAEGASNKTVRGAALKQFAEFLEQHDSKHEYCGLRQIVSSDASEDGAFACWTMLTDEEIKALAGA